MPEMTGGILNLPKGERAKFTLRAVGPGVYAETGQCCEQGLS
jgi:hypothetical protein